MNETSKTRRLWSAQEHAILSGNGIDIGCGPDPVTPSVQRFDLADGDANHITRHIKTQFDFVYSSHCLEHMLDPRAALAEWWRLVRPGGHLFFIVPDEDLYEQGVFPSRFNPDHRVTFTLRKERSWSPVSVNVLDLARGLPGSELVSATLQDHGYDHRLQRLGPDRPMPWPARAVVRAYAGFRRRGLRCLPVIERYLVRWIAIDQTRRPHAVAQIQCIVRKRLEPISSPSSA